MIQRQLDILKILSEKKKIEVSELSKLCKVSTVTIRKDLDKLESNGFLQREHGFAILNNEDNIKYRLAIGYEEKHAIALKALKFIEPNETVMIESGSSCSILALELAKLKQNNTIITNSTFIARYLSDYPMTKIILLGGEYQSTSEAVVGPLIKNFLSNFNVKKFFIGTDGFDEVHGFTSSDYERCEAVRTMQHHTEQVFVVSQSYKFNEYASFSLFDLKTADYLITDDSISEEAIDMLNKHGVEVI